MDLQLDHKPQFVLPFRLFLSGPSNSGKSLFILRLIQNLDLVFESQFKTIFYCHPYYDTLGEKDKKLMNDLKLAYPSIIITHEIPPLLDLQRLDAPTLLILDDLISSIVKNESMAHLYSIYSSHCNVSIITTTQNYFEPGKFSKTIIRNQTILVLFQTNSDRQSTNIITRQIFPGQSHFLEHCFLWLVHHVKKREHRYLIVNCQVNSKTPPSFPQVSTNLFSEFESDGPIFFAPS